MRKVLPLLFAAVLLCFASQSQSGDYNGSGKWAVSWLDSDYCCDPEWDSCDDLQVDSAPIWGPPDFTSLSIYVVAVEVDAIDGTRFGICAARPENIYFYGRSAADGTTEDKSPGWPGNGEGIDLSWGASQSGPFVVMGYLQVVAYGSARFCLCEDPRVGYAEWRYGSDITRRKVGGAFGCVGIGPGKLGYNPCGNIVPVQQTSWGAIKALYRR